MDRQRQIRQQVDELFRANKKKQFSMEDIARLIGADEAETITALGSVRCPINTCQSYDTELTEQETNGFEVHHCNCCSHNTHIKRDARGYSILGWYSQ
jgi:hypothetical protein